MYALHSKTDKYNPCDIRQLDYIAQFMSDIRHINGNDNIIADTLARNTLNSVKSQPLDFECLAREKKMDATLEKIKSDMSLLIEQ